MAENEREIKQSYYAIIPANVRYDKDLTPNSKLLYGEITALCNQKGYCWATNDYFANLYGVSKTSISKWISSLVEKGYIINELIYKEGTKQIEDRYLRIVNTPIEEKLNTPIEEKFKDNNKSSNTTFNNTKEKERKKESASGYDAIINEMVIDEKLKDTTYEFIKMRKLIKKPMTDFALKKMLNKLFRLSNNTETQVAILEQSILNNWQDIYELKHLKGVSANANSNEPVKIPSWIKSY